MPVVSTDDAWTTIVDMNVRGAPLIAMVAAVGLAVEARAKRDSFASVDEAKLFLLERWAYLRTSRPTAVNLFEAADRLEGLINTTASSVQTPGTVSFTQCIIRDIILLPGQLVDAYIAGAEAMLEKDVADNQAIGKYGAEAILAKYGGGAFDVQAIAEMICRYIVQDLMLVSEFLHTATLDPLLLPVVSGFACMFFHLGVLPHTYSIFHGCLSSFPRFLSLRLWHSTW